MVKSVYIHVPFCNKICNYCDFCKIYYNEEYANKYIVSLEKEIREKYNNEFISTIYIGGGTPSILNDKQLHKLLEMTKVFNLNKNIEFTFECNIEDISISKLNILKQYNVNRLSIGVQTFDDNLLAYLGRSYTKKDIVDKINMCKKLFNNINIDLIYAIPKQTIQQLKYDLDMFLKLNITHISTYSLIIEPNTKLYINKQENIDEDLDYEMYKLIQTTLKANHYNQYEISNFSKKTFQSKHNLTYWNNEEYYGFGLGSCGYINNIRYQNTKNINSYINCNYTFSKEVVDLSKEIENEFMLGFRKIKGINKKEFKNKYFDIYKIDKIKELIKTRELIDDGQYIFVNPKYLYISNTILVKLIG